MTATVSGGSQEFRADQVLVALGRRPVTDGLNLDAVVVLLPLCLVEEIAHGNASADVDEARGMTGRAQRSIAAISELLGVGERLPDFSAEAEPDEVPRFEEVVAPEEEL